VSAVGVGVHVARKRKATRAFIDPVWLDRKEEAQRRAVRRGVMFVTPDEARPRVKALLRMPPVTQAEADAAVAAFLEKRAATPCPTRAAQPIRNGLGFDQ
jgi:hypothetical protein